MKQGRSLQEFGRELTRQRKARKDFVADTRSLGLASDGRASVLTVSTGNDRQEFGVNELAHQQISARRAIPYRYYQKMQTEQPRLLDENVNTWFQKTPATADVFASESKRNHFKRVKSEECRIGSPFFFETQRSP